MVASFCGAGHKHVSVDTLSQILVVEMCSIPWDHQFQIFCHKTSHSTIRHAIFALLLVRSYSENGQRCASEAAGILRTHIHPPVMRISSTPS
jgi:hypothetical protein